MPTSAAKVIANRYNARKSTGPRTETGKASSSRNAKTHGLLARENIVLPGQESTFAELEAGLRNDLNPQGTLQHVLFETIVHAAWNVRRCRQMLAQLQATAHDPSIDMLHDDTLDEKYHRVDLYRRRNESSFNRSVKELRTLQTEAAFRDVNPEAAAIADHAEASILVNTQTIVRLNRQCPKPAPEPPENSKPSAPRGPVELPPFVAEQIRRYQAEVPPRR